MGSLREYETVFVLHPSLEETRVEEEIEGVRGTIQAGSGEIVDVERWGRRKFAYTIRKVHEGIYTLIRFRADASVVSDLERRYRLREDILRHLTVLSQGPPVEMIRRREGAVERPLVAGAEEDGSLPREGEPIRMPGEVPAATAGSGASAIEEADTETEA